METLTQNSLTLYLDKTLVEPETRTTLLQSFETFFNQTQEWKEKAEGLVITSIDQKAEMKQAKEARLALKNIRVNTEHKRKELKEESLRKGQTIDAIALIIKNEILPIEEYLEKQEKFIEIQEAKHKAELAEERLKQLQAYDFQYNNGFHLGDMDDQMFYNLLLGVQKAYNDKIEVAKKTEEERIAVEKAAAEAEAERLRIEAEERAEIEAENKRLKEEAEAREKEYHDLRKLKDTRFEKRKPVLEAMGFTWDEVGGSFFIRDVYSCYWETIVNDDDHEFDKHVASIKNIISEKEKNRIEAEQKQIELDKAKAEAEKLQAELKAKQEAEEQRIREAQEREEAELSRGDADKFQALITDIETLKGKYSFKSKKYKTLQNNINELLNKTVVYAQSKI